MKKSFIKAICAGLLVLGFTSCASYQKEAALMQINNNNINTYVAADLDYANAKRVQATVNTRTLFGFIQLERNGNKTLKSINRYKFLTKPEAQALANELHISRNNVSDYLLYMEQMTIWLILM